MQKEMTTKEIDAALDRWYPDYPEGALRIEKLFLKRTWQQWHQKGIWRGALKKYRLKPGKYRAEVKERGYRIRFYTRKIARLNAEGNRRTSMTMEEFKEYMNSKP